MIVELVWTLVGLTGAVVSTRGFYLAQGDLHALRKLGVNSERRTIARIARRGAGSRLILQAFNALAGVLVLLRPGESSDRDLIGWIVIILIIGAAFLFVLAQIADLRDRTRLLKYGQAE